MARREDLLRREAEAWERLASSVDLLTSEQLERPGLTAEGWSVKDLLWHMAFWYEDTAQALEEMRAGTWDGEDPSREPGWTDRVNDEQAERSRTMPLGDVRTAWLGERRRMLEAFGALEEVTPDADEWFEEAGPSHAEAHLPDLERWAARLADGP